MKTSKIIVGIDPGTVVMGMGVIAINRNQVSIVYMDVLRFSSKTDSYLRLQKIHEKVSDIVKKYHPQEFAIEAPFFGKNVQSMLKLGRAQGVAIAAAMAAGVPVTEYSPRKIKQSITGNGNADKQQVLKMLQQILNFSEEPKYLDATDALAVALCHHYQSTVPVNARKSLKGWEEFLAKNPGRIR